MIFETRLLYAVLAVLELYRPCLPQTQRSVPGVLGLKACATTPNYFDHF